MGEVRTRNQVGNERSEGLIIKTAPENELLDHVSRDSETVRSDASMGEVRARNQVRNERSESSIYETAPVNQSLDHASQDLGTGNSDVISASMGEVRARNQMMNGRSESFCSSKIAALGNQLVSSMLISHHTSSNGTNDDYHDMLKQKIKANFEDWIFLIVSIILELLSAAFDQASSPSKSNYALIGMLFAIVAVISCICELIHKVKREGAKLGRWGMLWWFYHPPPTIT
ncbi:uncharacterized protein LOC121049811 [Rosa chinensis]|uniref:uncharacterized protein LOC121049811 n=1 Tax=Rosa chinensis TaxID=74649 RepID=UPI001AD8A594|nr:uncharacterized protein LOC121049811 [Rosa chinensis]